MAETISSPQSKLTEISAVPRLVVDLTLRTPGIARTASSTGVVTSIAICSAGRSPASSVMRTRGKLICGKSATGREKLANAPASANAPSKNKMERAWLCAHAGKFIFEFTAPPRIRAPRHQADGTFDFGSGRIIDRKDDDWCAVLGGRKIFRFQAEFHFNLAFSNDL